MYVLSFVDEINCSYGPNSVSESIDIISVSDDVNVLIREAEADQGDVRWEENDMNQRIGYCLYDGEVDNDQFYIIVEV